MSASRMRGGKKLLLKQNLASLTTCSTISVRFCMSAINPMVMQLMPGIDGVSLLSSDTFTVQRCIASFRSEHTLNGELSGLRLRDAVLGVSLQHVEHLLPTFRARLSASVAARVRGVS
jgi:hypothetical protein